MTGAQSCSCWTHFSLQAPVSLTQKQTLRQGFIWEVGRVNIGRPGEARWEREGSDKGAACSRGNLQMPQVLRGGGMGLALAGPCGHHSPGSSAPVSCSGPPGQGERGASHRSTLGGQLLQDREFRVQQHKV